MAASWYQVLNVKKKNSLIGEAMKNKRHRNKQLTGKQRDEETALDYFGARFFDSDIARFEAVGNVPNNHFNK